MSLVFGQFRMKQEHVPSENFSTQPQFSRSGESYQLLTKSPLNRFSSAALLAGPSINELTFRLEVITNVGVDRGKLLEEFHLSESWHRSRSP